MRRGDYGYDAPYALVLLSGCALVGVGLAVWGWLTDHHGAVPAGALYGLLFGLNSASFLYTTRRGKLLVWDAILDGLALTGAERVLDLGCGRGAVLTAVAKRLTTGRVTGIDLWVARDQSGNSPDTTRTNVEREGVRERVQLETGDMRKLPFADASFELVVSSLAIHNIRSHADRAQAVREAFRVLVPGGRLVIADIRSTRRYAATLTALGASDVQRRGLGWRFWYGGPIGRTTLVTARKR